MQVGGSLDAIIYHFDNYADDDNNIKNNNNG